MQNENQSESELNELIRKVAQVCATCRVGRARMACHKKCHNARVRKWLKQIEQIQQNQQ